MDLSNEDGNQTDNEPKVDSPLETTHTQTQHDDGDGSAKCTNENEKEDSTSDNTVETEPITSTSSTSSVENNISCDSNKNQDDAKPQTLFGSLSPNINNFNAEELQQLKPLFLQLNEKHNWLSQVVPNQTPSSKEQEKMEKILQLNADLEKEGNNLKARLKTTEEKLASHDKSAKNTIENLMRDSEKKVKDLAARLSNATSNHQASVVNYARKEKEILDLQKHKLATEEQVKSCLKERDKLANQLKVLRSDYYKSKALQEKKVAECQQLNQDKQKLKDEISSHVIKVRWAQNKLKSEVDAHRETRERCDKMHQEIQQAKEETEQIRKNCQNMIKTYSESEEIKSNSLDIQLKDKLQELEQKSTEVNEITGILAHRTAELNSLKEKHKELIESNTVNMARLSLFEQEREKNEQVMRTYEEVMNKQKLNASELNERLNCMEELRSENERLMSEIDSLHASLADKDDEKESIIKDLQRRTAKEQELLQFTEKMSSKNTELTVTVEELKHHSQELQVAEKRIETLTCESEQLHSEQQESSRKNQAMLDQLSAQLADKEKAICQMSLQMEEQKDEMRTLKRKNAGKIKDLTRQLQHAKKKMESGSTTQHNSGGSLHPEVISLGSRTSSTASLEQLETAHEQRTNGGSLVMNSNAVTEHDLMPATAVAGPDTYDRQILIERIVRLQQIHAKKIERIDFLNEHTESLVEELKKKQRIIEHYILREEAGVLAPSRHGKDKQGKGRALTLDLSMEINRKMQSVLEDTILKNITLKESLELMGKEIQRLQCTTTTSGKTANNNNRR